MTTSHAAHGRSNKRQQAPGRPSRPALNQRHSHHAHTKSHHRPASSKGKAEITIESDAAYDDGDDSMANTFLQYCAVCDKQIVVPGSSMLYCSEKCRRSDTSNSPSYSIFKTDSNPPPPGRSSFAAASPQPRDIVPQLSPTISHHRPRYPSQASNEYFASDSESASSSYRDRSARPSSSRTDSEAARYLGQFQSGDRPVSRPRYSRSSGTNTPMLSTTPTSSTSASIPYTPTSAHTPLPPRNPRWSHASSSSRSVDLVTPITYYSTAPSSLTTVTDKMAGTSIDDRSSTPTLAVSPPGADGLSYEKRTTVSGSVMSPGRSSLKQLFRFDHMRSTPGQDQHHRVDHDAR